MISPATLEELRDFDTPLIANTIGFISPVPPHEYYLSGEIQSVTRPLGPTVGIAFTVEIDSSTPGGKAETELYWELLDLMRQSSLPSVLVAKAAGSRPEHECMIGDGMAKTLFSVGCVGLVSDGRVRDVPGLISTNFAAYCRGTIAHHAPLRLRSIQRPVEVGGVTITPGEVIHADHNGVIRVPAECLDDLAKCAVKNRAFEHEAHMFLRRVDKSPADKRDFVNDLVAKYGFNDCVSARKP